MTVEYAQALFQTWRGDEWGWLKARILMIGMKYGEYHGDYLAKTALAEPNIIGALVRSMVSERLLESTGEHRKGAAPAAHGRRSYVYRLTERGARFARLYKDSLIDLGRTEPEQPPEQLGLLG